VLGRAVGVVAAHRPAATMPQYQDLPCGGQVVDIDTALKDGILGGAPEPGDAAPDAAAGAAEDDGRAGRRRRGRGGAGGLHLSDLAGAHAGSGDALHGADVRAAQHLPLAGAGPPGLPHHHAGALERRAHPQRHPPPAHRRHARFRKRSADVHGRAARLVHALRGRQQPLKGRAAAHQSVAKAGGVTLLASLLGPFTSHAVGSEAVAILVGGVLAGLQLLNSICAEHSPARTMIVSIGAVAQLLATECVEPGPWTVLDALSAVPEGRAALKDCPRTIPNAVRLLMRVRAVHAAGAVHVVAAVSDGA
jgi:hypothetical protein